MSKFLYRFVDAVTNGSFFNFLKYISLFQNCFVKPFVYYNKKEHQTFE